MNNNCFSHPSLNIILALFIFFKIKQEPVSESEDEGVSTESNTVNETTSKTVAVEKAEKAEKAEKSVRPSRSASEKSKANRPLNTSGESLYEDAMSQPMTNTTNVSIIRLKPFV